MVDSWDGGTFDGSDNGLLGFNGEGTNFGEGGRFNDTLDTGDDVGGVEGSEIGGAN